MFYIVASRIDASRHRFVCSSINLVDPANGQMFVSKIKPCMSQHWLLHGNTANGWLKQLKFICWHSLYGYFLVILELLHAYRTDVWRVVFIRFQTFQLRLCSWWFMIKILIAFGDESFKFQTYQLSMAGYWPTMALTGNTELGFGSGDKAQETATTLKESSRRVNYPILTQRGSDKKWQYKASMSCNCNG